MRTCTRRCTCKYVTLYLRLPPRRAQQPISFRSDKAAARLALLTRSGRSQAEVIEDALDRVGEQGRQADRAAALARLDEIIERIASRNPPVPTMAEFDAREYDARGNPV